MLTSTEFIKKSLELHLFLARIMKEHSFFLEAGFTPKNSGLAQQADNFKKQFEGILAEAISLSNCVVSCEVLKSGEVITPYTLNAEIATQYFSGVALNTGLTQAAACLSGDGLMQPNPFLENCVCSLNTKAMQLVSGLIQFKTVLLSNVLSCKIFTFNYPLLIDHILREAKLYLCLIQRLQNRQEIACEAFALEQELFWNRIMAEHAKFIRGLLDPTEDELIQTANNFGKEFDALTAEAKAAMDKTVPLGKVTNDSLIATEKIRDFKTQGTQGILECKIKSIIIPLLADHTIREASHFLRLLKQFEKCNR